MQRLSIPGMLGRAALTALAVAGLSTLLGAQQTSLSPAELVQRTVQNEINSNDVAKFMFRDTKQTPRGSQTKLMLETRDAMAAMLIAENGHPLTQQQLQAEQARLDALANNPETLQHKKKQEKEDEARTKRIVRALPDAFIYSPDGTEEGKPGVGKTGHELLRFKFRPNPAYDPPSRTEQVLTGMQGTILIDADRERIARIDGTLFKDVGFGWGILGHLDRGGHFLVEQGEVGGDSWQTTHMSLSFTGKILMFKSLNIKQEETASDFRPAPPNLTFAQGVEFLKKQVAELAENENGGAQKNVEK